MGLASKNASWLHKRKICRQVLIVQVERYLGSHLDPSANNIPNAFICFTEFKVISVQSNTRLLQKRLELNYRRKENWLQGKQ